MKKLMLVVVIIGVAIYFKVVKAETILSATGKVIDGTVRVVGTVVKSVSNEVK